MTRGDEITLFLCGDVMTGRGVDQVLPFSCDPRLYEPVVRSAAEYVTLAERRHGPIPRPMDAAYLWGEALDILERVHVDARIVNLETSVTARGSPAPKQIHYRMHPGNVAVLMRAGINCCVLANNHVLDWGEAGLLDTLDALAAAGIATAGAGRDLAAAWAPAVFPLANGGRVLVFACGVPDSGIPAAWAAGSGRPGVHLVPRLTVEAARSVAGLVGAMKRAGDIAVASIHWGGNWGYAIPRAHRRFAHELIDRAGIDLVHGHSSHHAKAVEVYNDRAILYGCGDFLSDYEGIRGFEEYRSDLAVMYFVVLSGKSGRLLRLEMAPLRLRNFRLNRPPAVDVEWLRAMLDRECGRFGNRVAMHGEFLALEPR